MDHVLDHGARGKARLIQQYRGKPLFEGLVELLSGQAQGIEDEAWDVLQQRAIAVAEGAQLDGIGAIVGAARDGLGDAAYRLRLRTCVQLNRCRGTHEDVRACLNALMPGLALDLVDYPPAGFHALYSDLLTASADDALRVLHSAKPVGVAGVLVYRETALPRTALCAPAVPYAIHATLNGGVLAGAASFNVNAGLEVSEVYPEPQWVIINRGGANAECVCVSSSNNTMLMVDAENGSALRMAHSSGELVEQLGAGNRLDTPGLSEMVDLEELALVGAVAAGDTTFYVSALAMYQAGDWLAFNDDYDHGREVRQLSYFYNGAGVTTEPFEYGHLDAAPVCIAAFGAANTARAGGALTQARR